MLQLVFRMHSLPHELHEVPLWDRNLSVMGTAQRPRVFQCDALMVFHREVRSSFVHDGAVDGAST